MSQEINSQLQQKKLSSLRAGLITGMWADQERRKKLEKVALLIQSAVFLQKDGQRKKDWVRILHTFDDAFLDRLVQAIIDEDICYKKGERDIVVELNRGTSQRFS